MIYISVSKTDGVEALPLPEDTPFWDASAFGLTKKEERNYNVYNAIRAVENYYQFNSPTAFGNPDYSRACGYLSGLLQGYGLEMQKIDNKIIVKTMGGVKLMIIECPQKPESYIRDKAEINSIIRDILG